MRAYAAAVITVLSSGCVRSADTNLVWRTVREDLTIGGESDDPRYIFGRVADVAVDSRGRIYALDQQAQEIKVYDAGGGFIHAVAGPGRGPGELSRWANAVLIGVGDTLYAPDYAQTRINVFAPDGAYVRAISVPARPGGQSWTLLPDGRFLFRGTTTSRDAEGRFQTWDALLVTGADNAAQLDTLVPFDYPHTQLGTRQNLRVPLIVNSPFWARLDDGTLVWSALDQEQVYVHDAAGGLIRVIDHAGWNRRPTSPGDHAAMVELLREKLQRLGGDVAAADGPAVESPEWLPAITGIHAGPENTIWVQRMGDVASIDPMSINANDRVDGLGGPQWDVFDVQGERLGMVRLPDRFRIRRIVGETVYGVAKDALDREAVTRLRLVQQ